MDGLQVFSYMEVAVVNVIRRNWPAGESLTGFPGPAYPLWFILEGSIDIRYPDNDFRVHQGQCLLSPPLKSRFISTPAGCDWIGVALQAGLDNGFDWLRQLVLPVRWKPDDREATAIRRLMLDMVREWDDLAASEGKDGTGRLIVSGMGRTLLGLSLRSLQSSGLQDVTGSGLPAWLPAALEIMDREPHLHISQIAARCGYSPTQFRRLFGACLGLAPHLYLQRIRMAKARRLLETTDAGIGDIALSLGFSSQAHFTRLFGRTFGMSPSRYRKDPGIL